MNKVIFPRERDSNYTYFGAYFYGVKSDLVNELFEGGGVMWNRFVNLTDLLSIGLNE